MASNETVSSAEKEMERDRPSPEEEKNPAFPQGGLCRDEGGSEG